MDGGILTCEATLIAGYCNLQYYQPIRMQWLDLSMKRDNDNHNH